MRETFISRNVLVSFLAVFVILLCALVLISWSINYKPLLNIIPRAPTMKVNTAILFILSGFGVLTILNQSHLARVVNAVLASAIVFVAFITLMQYILGMNIGIDNVFFTDKHSAIYPGRMATSTAFCFILIGLSIFGGKSERFIIKRIFNILLTLITLISILAITTYILQIVASSNIRVFSTMAIHTAILFFLLSFSISLKNPQFSYVGFLTGNYNGSKLARSLLPLAIGLPLLLSCILLYNFQIILPESEFAIALYTIAYAAISFAYITIISNRVNNADLKRAKLESSLRQSNRELWQYKHALNQSSIISITDPSGVIKHVNDKFCEISGYEKEDIIGKTHEIVRSGYQSEKFYDDMWKEISDGRVWIGGIKNKSRTGDNFWLHTAIVPFVNTKGEIYQYLSIQQDVTKQYWLAAQYDTLKLQNKEMEQFTYIASHDLQEPLRTLKGISEMLLAIYADKLDADGLKSLQYISNSVDRMSALVKGLLDYSRIGLDNNPEIFVTDEIIKDIKADLGAQIEKSDAVIIEKNSVELKAYKTEFRLLLQNLISNAIKFQKSTNQPRIEISIESDYEKHLFAVKDNGIGIVEENPRTIFSIFRTNHNNKAYFGTGIGLAHCEKIVHLHGGQIWYDSNDGQGTTFYFTIPKF